MSASTTPMRRPSAASSAAMLAVVFDLPVPPRKECMAMILDMFGLSRLGCIMLGAEAQPVRLTLQILEVVGLGDLRHLTSGPGFVDLDAQLLHLLLEALLAGADFARHLLKDPRQLPQLVARTGSTALPPMLPLGVFPEEHLARNNHGLLDVVGLSPPPVLLDELLGVGVPAQQLNGPCIIGWGGDVLVGPSRRIVPVHRRASSHP